MHEPYKPLNDAERHVLIASQRRRRPEARLNVKAIYLGFIMPVATPANTYGWKPNVGMTIMP